MTMNADEGVLGLELDEPVILRERQVSEYRIRATPLLGGVQQVGHDIYLMLRLDGHSSVIPISKKDEATLMTLPEAWLVLNCHRAPMQGYLLKLEPADELDGLNGSDKR